VQGDKPDIRMLYEEDTPQSILALMAGELDEPLLSETLAYLDQNADCRLSNGGERGRG